MLQRDHRLRRRRDFSRVYRRGKIVHQSSFSVKFAPNNRDHCRVGVVASTKVSKKAVVRNRIRRRLYGQVRELWPRLQPGFDIIILARYGAYEASAGELRQQLLGCFDRADLLH